MYRIELILSVIDQAVETKKRRHIIGGILTSMAALFGGLAATVFSLKGNQTNDISEVTEDGDYIDFEGNFGPYYGEDKGGWK